MLSFTYVKIKQEILLFAKRGLWVGCGGGGGGGADDGCTYLNNLQQSNCVRFCMASRGLVCSSAESVNLAPFYYISQFRP